MKYRQIIYIGIASLLLTACKETDELSENGAPTPDNIIHVGGIAADELIAHATTMRDAVDETTVTKTDAENVEWLRQPLFEGLDITYGKASDRTNTSRVAQLKLLKDGDNIKYSDEHLAEYSFLFRDNTTGDVTSNPAIWHDNGAHFFEGLYLPNEIKFAGSDALEVYGASGTAPNLTTDQHVDATTGTLGNYTLLSRYLAMPSNFTLNATVARVKLPFRHRLARVIAYILIDPSMGSDVKLQDYSLEDGKDDPSTTKIRFNNVGVLAGVKARHNTSAHHYTYTPQWETARKVVPHFVGERGSFNDKTNTSLNDNFIAYYDTEKSTYIYPTDANWPTVNALIFTNDKSGKYERTVYGKVPVYDLIVQPTYTSLNNVMYDEEGVTDANTKNHLYVATNQIDFELTLSNGLNYTKKFVFDLDANYQTVVYLHISRERVDYNSSGSDLWQETIGYDDYYGVNNQNGNILSVAGSSWQRAYTNKELNYDVTDGHQYQQDGEDEYAQYVTDARWIEMLREAKEGGKHHGDYFILDHNISIPAAAFPDNFVFTGHLDGQDHTITITDDSYTPVIHDVTITYEDYTNESGRETKYVLLGNDTYTEFYAGEAAYYEKIVTPAVEPETEPTITYNIIPDIYAYTGSTAYRRSGEEGNYTYTEIKFYKKVRSETDTDGSTIIAKLKPYHLFEGLNGKYSTAQESNKNNEWQANVHQEGDYWVPYTNGTTGWRAEIINTNFKIDTANGCSVFKQDAVWGTDITGYLFNCWVNSTFTGTPPKWSGTRITDHIPALPAY